MRPIPAGLFRRILAFGVDYVAISAYLLAVTGIGVVMNYATPQLAEAVFGQRVLAQVVGFALVTLPVSLYFVLQESSRWQATWGKRKTGLKVVTASSRQPITLRRAAVRTFAKFIPWELAHTFVWQTYSNPDGPSGLVMAGFMAVWVLVGGNIVSIVATGDRRAIYDWLAGTQVIDMRRVEKSGAVAHTLAA
ncbi:MAG: RDD family protein [Dehalococcoidia bacterium]